MKRLLALVTILAVCSGVFADHKPAPKKAEPTIVVQMTLAERIRQNRIERLTSLQERSLSRRVFVVAPAWRPARIVWVK